jgi:arylsulfatase A-like enzyme
MMLKNLKGQTEMGKYNRRQFLKVVGGLFATAGIGGCIDVGAGAAARKKPNFVFFLIDDMGCLDLGCYGSKLYETPNIDRLARQGMRFTDAYAACAVCSPTRASILTGKYPARLNITDWIGGSQKGKLLPAKYEHQLPLEEVTIAEALKVAGYATGFIGKWHIGDEGFYPQQQGFDLNIAGHGAGHPASFFYPYKGKKQSYWDVPDLEGGSDGEYLTDRLTDESLKFIEAGKDRPFLLYLSHYAVHMPIQSKKELEDKYKNKLKETGPGEGAAFKAEGKSFTKQFQDDAAYAGMIESVDHSVGRVIDKLKELGLADNTIVIFMSDNGGLSTIPRKWSPTSNLPLRAGKGWYYEGGIREPMIVKWPGVVKAGSVCSEPVTSTDFYPTMLEMAGLKKRPGQHADGVSLVELLKGNGALDREAIYWHSPHYHGSGNRPCGAVRAGDYKLIEWFEDGSTELYNLRDDIAEKNDLAAKMPEKAAKLRKMLVDWRKEVDAQMPTPNPEWK